MEKWQLDPFAISPRILVRIMRDNVPLSRNALIALMVKKVKVDYLRKFIADEFGDEVMLRFFGESKNIDFFYGPKTYNDLKIMVGVGSTGLTEIPPYPTALHRARIILNVAVIEKYGMELTLPCAREITLSIKPKTPISGIFTITAPMCHTLYIKSGGNYSWSGDNLTTVEYTLEENINIVGGDFPTPTTSPHSASYKKINGVWTLQWALTQQTVMAGFVPSMCKSISSAHPAATYVVYDSPGVLGKNVTHIAIPRWGVRPTDSVIRAIGSIDITISSQDVVTDIPIDLRICVVKINSVQTVNATQFMRLKSLMAPSDSIFGNTISELTLIKALKEELHPKMIFPDSLRTLIVTYSINFEIVRATNVETLSVVGTLVNDDLIKYFPNLKTLIASNCTIGFVRAHNLTKTVLNKCQLYDPKFWECPILTDIVMDDCFMSETAISNSGI